MAVTKQALEEVAKNLFKEMDLDKNGKLEKSEVKKFTEKTMQVIKPGEAFDEKEFEDNFKKLDKNSDGTVSPDELLASLISKAEESGCFAEGQ